MIQSLPPVGNDRKRKERCCLIVVSIRIGKIEAIGHAGAGNGIVCSAISCLFQTLVASICSLTDDRIEYDIEPGSSRMIYEDLSDGSKLLIDSFFIGVCGVAEAYPDAVTIN